MLKIEQYVQIAEPTDIQSLQSAIIVSGDMVKEDNPGKPLYLVSGKVTGKDAKTTKKNEKKLVKKARKYQRRDRKKIYFSSGQIMTPKIRAAIAPSNPQYMDFVNMWGNVVDATVDGLVMAHGWEGSTGARRENEVATRKGIPIKYERTFSERIFPFRRHASRS